MEGVEWIRFITVGVVGPHCTVSGPRLPASESPLNATECEGMKKNQKDLNANYQEFSTNMTV